jgi:hypothetical protein
MNGRYSFRRTKRLIREGDAPTTSLHVQGSQGLIGQAAVLWAVLVVAIAALVGLLAILGSQFLAQAKAGVKLEQCSNFPTVCDTSNPSKWQTGNLGQNDSRYFEGDVVPYRAILGGLTPGEHYSVGIGWDTSKSGRQAIDYLATFNRTVSTAAPCAGLACGADTDTLSIPIDPALSGQGVNQLGGQVFTLFGGNFHTAGLTFDNGGNFCGLAECTVASNPSMYSPSGSFASDRKNKITVSFEATSETVVVAWGGHLASRKDWGPESSAATIPGSPYHMRIEGFACTESFGCSSGQMERSINSSGVYLFSAIKIVKEVDLSDSDVAAPSFGFIAGPAPLTDFVLDDLTESQIDEGIWRDEILFDEIRNEGEYTVSESAQVGWELDEIVCSVESANKGTQRVKDNSVVIDIREGEFVTCVFVNKPDGEGPPPTTTTTTTVAPTTTVGPVITQPGTVVPEATTTMTMPTVPTTLEPEVTIEIQAETTAEEVPILPTSGAVIGLSDVMLALLFLSLGFGTLALVRTRNDRSQVN